MFKIAKIVMFEFSACPMFNVYIRIWPCPTFLHKHVFAKSNECWVFDVNHEMHFETFVCLVYVNFKQVDQTHIFVGHRLYSKLFLYNDNITFPFVYDTLH